MIEFSFNAIWIPIILSLPIVFVSFTAKDAIGVVFGMMYAMPISLVAWIAYAIFK